MTAPKFDLSKIKSLTTSPLGDGHHLVVLYKSGQKRGYTFGPGELGLGDILVKAQSAGIEVNSPLLDNKLPPHPYGDCIELMGEPCDLCLAEAKEQDEALDELDLLSEALYGPDAPTAPQPPDGAVWCEWCNEHPALPGEPCDECRKLGADPAFRYEQTGKGQPAPESTPEPETVAFISLAEMLGLAGEQAQKLEGTTRLNFWRNGSLWMQIEHGCRATKVKLPTAVVTDAQLDAFFAGWGWQKLGNKPYYKPTAASLVRI